MLQIATFWDIYSISPPIYIYIERRTAIRVKSLLSDKHMVIRLDGCSESPARRRSHVNYSTIVLPDFV